MAESQERVVGRNFLALGGGDAVARVIAFGATIYLTRVLGTDGYGVVAVASAVTLYLAQFANFGIDTLGIREVAEDRKRIDETVPAILTFRTAYTALMAVVVAAIAVLAIPPPDGRVIALFAFSLIPQAASAKWVLLGLESAAPVGISRVAGEALMLLLVIGLVRETADLWAVPSANVAGELLAALILFAVLRRRGHRMKPEWNLAKAKPIFVRAWPIVGHSLLGLLIYNSDLIFLRVLRSSAEVGLYAAAYNLISFLLNLGVAYGTSLLPTLTRVGRESEEERALYQTAHAQVFAASLPIALGGTLLADPLMEQVFGADYRASGAPLAILIWSVPFCLFRNVAIAGLIARERQDQMLRTTVWSAVLNAVGNLSLIPFIGMAGAAIATLITEILRSALALIYARQENLHFGVLSRHWRACAAGAAMVGVLFLVRPYGLWEGFLTFAGIAVGGVAYLFAMIAVGGIRFSEGRPRLQV